MNRLLPTVRQDLEHENERLRDLALENFYNLSSQRSRAENAHSLAGFLGIGEDQANEILNLDHLFND